MKNNHWLFVLTLLTGIAVSVTGCGKFAGEKSRTVTWEQCLNQLTDFPSVASLEPVNLKMLTSFDRTGGNNDFNNFAGPGREAGWMELVDEKGPGCIRRIWMTGTDPGHPIRIYIDGEKTPRIDSTLDDLFGTQPPWTPPLAQYVNMGFYSYLPITFNKSIRIEVKEPNVHPFWGPRRIFHQIAVELFPPDTAVESYPATFSESQLQAAANVNVQLQEMIDSRSLNQPDEKSEVTVPAQAAVTLLELNGPRMMDRWQIDVRPVDADAWTAIDHGHLINDTVIRVYYDGQDKPGIDVPLGDFFANAWHKRAFGSAWMTSGEQGYECRLPMPFKQSIKIEVLNGADQPVTASFRYSLRDLPTNQTGYLHAEYRRSGPTGGNHLITRVNGKGKFLGCFLGVTGLDASWWILEGDERMWVDGNTEPVWHGTGLEDYFNGAWYYRGAAFGSFSANFDRAPFRVAQFRHQHADPVSFDHYFQMEFERMNNEQNGQPVNGFFESVAYMYLEKPTPVYPCPASRDERRAVDSPNHQQTFMLQLVELERSNDFEAAIRAIQEYLERYPDSEESGVYRLRLLEYRRLLGQAVSSSDYDSFRDGTAGAAAQEQVKLLDWFYENENRAIIGLSVNGKGRLFLDGKLVLSGDHPFHLFAAGIELAAGNHQLAAQVDYQRGDPWLQAGIRTHTGVDGTGPGTAHSLSVDPQWRSTPVDALNWGRCDLRLIPRGVPDAPLIGGIANAFILLQSKTYPVSAQDWVYYRSTAYFREDVEIPMKGYPSFSISTTGLSR